MSDSFNGYHVWLGIPPSEQPPNHYRLLGIALFETDLDVIDHAADRQMAHVRTFQSGRHAPLSQQMLNELAAARLCLLNPQRKTAYDEELRAKIGAAKVAQMPVGKALPVARPSAQPVAVPVPRAAPVAPRDDLDEIEVDLSNSAPLASRVDDDEDDLLGGRSFSPVPAIQVRGSGRVIDRDASLMRSMVYIFAGVVVLVVILVLFDMLRRMVGTADWHEWFSAPESSSPVEPDASPAPMPEAPPPAPPSPR
jgi:hypothetical protein